MSDFSLFSLFTAGLACLIPLTAAYTQPTGNAPVGNPISEPGLNSVVPAGQTFTITWEPTTKGTVTLVLLKGPSKDAIPQYPIVEKTPNDGVYIWSVSDDLEPTQDATGYGIQLIDDATGQYQYTTQFGISNSDYKASSGSTSSSSEASKSTSTSAPAITSSAVHSAQYYSDYTTYCPSATTFSIKNQTYTVSHETTLTISDCSCTITKSHSTYVSPPKGTGSFASAGLTKPANGTGVVPTGVVPTGYAPSTLSSATATYVKPTISASQSTGPVYTGGASTMAVSFFGVVLAAGVGALAL